MKVSYELKDGYVSLWSVDTTTFPNVYEITRGEELRHFNDNYGDYKQVGTTLQYDDKHNFKAELEADRANRLRAEEVKTMLIALTEDIVQSLAGEVVPDIDERKAEFVALHNELRALEGKEPRATQLPLS